jgi:hypothetical protein
MRLAISLRKAAVFVGFPFRTKASIASLFTMTGHTVKTSASKPSIANISIVLTEAAEAISDFGVRDFGVRDFGVRDIGTSVFGISDFGFRDFSFRKVSEKKVQFFAIFLPEISFPDILLISRYVTHFPITFRQGTGRGRGLGEGGVRERLGERGRRSERGDSSVVGSVQVSSHQLSGLHKNTFKKLIQILY